MLFFKCICVTAVASAVMFNGALASGSTVRTSMGAGRTAVGMAERSLSSCAPVLLTDGEPAVVVVLVGGINTQLFSTQWQPLNQSKCPDRQNGHEGEHTLRATGVVDMFHSNLPADSDLVQFLAKQGALVLPYSYEQEGFSLSSNDGKTTASVEGYTKLAPGGDVLPDSSKGATPGTAAYQLNAELRAINKTWNKSRILVVGHSNGGLVAERWWQDPVRGKAVGVGHVLALDSPINGMLGNPCSAPTGLAGYCDFAGVDPSLVTYYNGLWRDRESNDLLITASRSTSGPTKLTLIGTRNDNVYKLGMHLKSPDWTLLPQLAFKHWKKRHPSSCAIRSGLTCSKVPAPDVVSSCNQVVSLKTDLNFTNSKTFFESHGQVVNCTATQTLLAKWLEKSERVGTKIWSYATGGGVYSSPVVVDGVVYAGSFDHKVYALNASTGTEIWSFATNDWVVSSPTVANGVVYVGSDDGHLYALNASTGAKIWSFGAGGLVHCAPAVANGTVYVGSSNDEVYALDAATGREIWSFATGSEVFSSSPTVVGGVVYIGSYDHNVYALNSSTGAKIWSFATGQRIVSSPRVVNGVLYIGSSDHNIYALNAATGTKIWSFATGNEIYSSPDVFKGVVYVGSNDHKVYALNASTGTEIWSFATNDWVASSPTVANGVVYVGSNDHDLYALNASTGAKVWSFLAGSVVWSSPAVFGSVVYVGSYDGNIYALKT